MPPRKDRIFKDVPAIASRKVAANQSQNDESDPGIFLRVLNRVTQEEHFALKLIGEIYSSPYKVSAVGATISKHHRKKQVTEVQSSDHQGEK